MKNQALYTAAITLSAFVSAESAFSKTFEFQGFEISEKQSGFNKMLDKAYEVIGNDERFTPDTAITDGVSTTLKFKQYFKGVEVVGDEAQFHYDLDGNLEDIAGSPLVSNITGLPSLSTTDAVKILSDRYQTEITLSEEATLKIIRDQNENPRLTYQLLTMTSDGHMGTEIYMDAHSGEILIEAARECTLHDHDVSSESSVKSFIKQTKITIYDANTTKARQYINPKTGAPTKIDLKFYNVAAVDKSPSTSDASVKRAFENSVTVYNYYKMTHGRLSYDGADTRLSSVVHIGKNFANAFWTNEFKVMAYGDGDGKVLYDLTLGLDVAAHELTHAVTSTTAKLIYAGESGALNESFSDIFGKMVDYNDNDWYIGSKVIGPELKAKGMKGIRNMIDPEEYKQPATIDSKYYVSTTGPCTRANDMCGVHKNSGVPNKIAYTIIKALGKQNAEKLFYNVLTQRLTASSKFVDMRKATESACTAMFKSMSSTECKAVSGAFDAAKIVSTSTKPRISKTAFFRF